MIKIFAIPAEMLLSYSKDISVNFMAQYQWFRVFNELVFN